LRERKLDSAVMPGSKRHEPSAARAVRRRGSVASTVRRLLGPYVLAPRWLAGLALLALIGTADADGPDRWRVYPSVGLIEKVTLRIHWFESSAELREAAKNGVQGINGIGVHGFSTLRRNVETGEYVCDVYVVKMTGADVDGDRTTTFGHEILHCFGLRHE
jgi:hypothetical protein